jgi:hypothetical protein
VTQSRSDLMRLTTDSFAFLEEIDGCERELIEPNQLLTIVAYKFADIAVELQFDWRDLDVACLMSRPSEGRLPGGHYLIHDGQRVRYRLGDLTPEVLNRFRQLPRPPKRRPPPEQWAAWQSDRMAESIRIYAGILRENIAELRSEAAARFQAAGQNRPSSSR